MVLAKLQKVYINKAETINNYQKELAAICGCVPGKLSDFKKEADFAKEFDDFGLLINVARNMCPDEELDMMNEYSLKLDPKKKTARCMLEYMDSHKLEATEELIEKMLTSKSVASEQWATLFDTDRKVYNKEITFHEAVKVYSSINPKNAEIRILCNILNAYVYLDQKLYSQAYALVEGLDIYFKEIKDEYMKKMLRVKIEMLMAEYYLRNNDLEKSRIESKNVLEKTESDSIKGWSLLNLANSYILTDYSQALNYLEQGLDLLSTSEAVVTNLKQSHNFLNNLWNKEAIYLNYESNSTSDLHEIAFHLINKNDKEAALDYLKKDKLEELTHNEKGFHFYLKGLITGSKVEFIESVRNFRLSGDVYFRQLPLMKLKEFGIDEMVINLLSE